MMRWIAALMASLALVACGIVHGFWTDRWVPPVETAQAAENLNAIPLEVGDWDGEVEKVKKGEAGEGVAGCIRRRYVNRKTGTVVSLFMVCGRPGPVGIHTPEACYGASGFQVAAKARFDAESGDTLWKTDVVLTRATEEMRQRVYWGWNGGSGWTASKDARVQFVRYPVLYKLYVIRELDGLTDSSRNEPCEEFVRVLLPVLRTTLFAPSS